MTASGGQRRPPDDGGAWVTASDVAAVAYCARSYWLRRVVRVAPSRAAAARMAVGQAAHAAHGHAVVSSRTTARWRARVRGAAVLVCLLALALVALALWQHARGLGGAARGSSISLE